jgi:rare lipoprotein A (peptidoglycan hydrolase)
VIRVTSKKTGASILVVVTDWCGCRGGKDGPGDDKIIDLAPEAFEALGMTLGVGVMKVTIEPVK